MKNVIRDVISRGAYDLSGMLGKINTLWAMGKISDGEKEELSSLARDNADVQKSIDIFKKLDELEKRVKALEDAKKTETEGESDEDAIPEYVAGKWYYNGDAVAFEGKEYECTAPVGTPCVWSPSEYPTYWKEK